MADIVSLVAEEYERRLNMARNKAGDEASTITGPTALFGPVYELKTRWMKRHFKSTEPQSEIGRAAFDGFFSA